VYFLYSGISTGKRYVALASRYCRNLEHRDALQLWRHRDEDSFKASAKGDGSLLTAAYRKAGKGRQVPKTGAAGPEQSGMG